LGQGNTITLIRGTEKKFDSILVKIACGVILSLFAAYANAALLTFNFSGRFNSSTALYNSGDTFSGSYTIETAAPVIDLTGDGDTSIDSRADAIDPGLPGNRLEPDGFLSRRAELFAEREQRADFDR